MKRLVLFIFILIACFSCNANNKISFISDGEVIGTVDIQEFEEFIPEKENHNFIGWYLDEDYSNEFDNTKELYSSLSIYAKWIEHTDISLFIFEEIGNNQLKIIGFKFEELNGKDVILPDKVFGKRITEMDAIFKDNELIEEIILSKDLKVIEDETFSNMTNLVTIKLPKDLIILGDKAFSNTKSLKGIVIPGGVEYLGDKTFFESGVKIVRVEEGVTYISNSMFENCLDLILIELPLSITEIGERAFYNCKSLFAIDIPDNVKVIKWNTFNGCKNLISVYLPEYLERIEGGAFSYCHDIAVLYIPKNTKSILPLSFEYINLRILILPSGITEMSVSAFESAKNIFYEGKSIPENWDDYWIKNFDTANVFYDSYPDDYYKT